MASGDPIFEVTRIAPPATLGAVPAIVAGGSTPAEGYVVYGFDASTAWYLDFMCRLSPGYAGGGVTLLIPWMAASATSGDCIWQAALRRAQLETEQMSASQTYDYNSVTDTAPGTLTQIAQAQITFTDGADMDSVAAGEIFILRIGRTAADGSDTMAGNANLLADLVVARET